VAAAQLVVVLADDLIWATRLVSVIGALPGHRAATVRSIEGLEARLAADGPDGAAPAASAVVVDLTSRAYDGLAAIALAAARGARVLAVGQHDDRPLRLRALASGAERVYAYRKLFEDGPATLGRWLAEQPASVSRRTAGAAGGPRD
jgi:hypothetical protein